MKVVPLPTFLGMKEIFIKNLVRLVGNPSEARFLLTVSGGRDSVVMTHLFHSCGLHFAVAHCNFHLRGEDSNEDMRFVQNLSEKFEVQLFIKEFDTISIQKESGKSVEMVARELRYQWFDELADDFNFVATAHHANDNAETLLLNLVRGTGLKGLSAIPEVNGCYIRPLLPFTSQQISSYAESYGLSFCVDQTNFSETYQRNKIRHGVLPKLAEINPEVISTFAKNIEHFRQQNEFYQRQISFFEKEMTSQNGDEWRISIPKIGNHPDRELLLYEFLKKFGFTKGVVNDLIRDWCGESGKLFFSETHCLLKDRDYLIVKEKTMVDETDEMLIHNELELEQNGFSLEKIEAVSPMKFERNPNIFYADIQKLTFPLALRHWRPGDSFVPLGMKGSKKLSDFFKDSKSTRFDKQSCWLLCCNERIAWIVGMRADERFRVDASTNFYYKIIYNGRI